jgi:hypothetical protein
MGAEIETSKTQRSLSAELQTDVLLSFPESHRDLGEALAASLEGAGLTIFGAAGPLPGEDIYDYFRRGVEGSIAVIVVATDAHNIAYEAELGMARARSGEGLFVPVVEAGAIHELKWPLHEFQALEVIRGREKTAADVIAEVVERWKNSRLPKLSPYVRTPVGRELVETPTMRQVEEGLNKWLSGDRRAIWIAGRTGTGKTVALEWASRHFESKFGSVDWIHLSGYDSTRKAFELEKLATSASQRVGPPALLIVDDLEPDLESAVLAIAESNTRVCLLVASQLIPRGPFRVITIEPMSYLESQRLFDQLLLPDTPNGEARNWELPEDRSSPLAVHLLAAGVSEAVAREKVRETADSFGFDNELKSSARTSFRTSHVHAMDVMIWVGSAWIPRAIVAGVGREGFEDVDSRSRQFEIDGLISLGVLLETGPSLSVNPYSSFDLKHFRAAISGIDAITDQLRSIRQWSERSEFIPDEMFVAASAALVRAAHEGKSSALERAIYLALETARIMVLVGRVVEADILLSDSLQKSSSLGHPAALEQTLRSQLARLKMTTGDLDEARLLLLQNIQRRSPNSTEDTSTLRDLSILADALIESSLWREAVSTLQEVCRITRLVAGQHRAPLVAAMSKLAFASERLGNWSEALQVRRDAFQLIVEDEGVFSSASITAGADLAGSLIGSGQSGAGVLLLRDLLQKSRIMWGESDPVTRTIEQNILLAEGSDLPYEVDP